MKKIIYMFLLVVIGLTIGTLARHAIEKYSNKTIEVTERGTIVMKSYNKISIGSFNIIFNETTTIIRLAGVDCEGWSARKKVCQGKADNGMTHKKINEMYRYAKNELRKILEQNSNNITFIPDGKSINARNIEGVLMAGDVNVNNYMLEKIGCWKEKLEIEYIPRDMDIDTYFARDREITFCIAESYKDQ